MILTNYRHISYVLSIYYMIILNILHPKKGWTFDNKSVISHFIFILYNIISIIIIEVIFYLRRKLQLKLQSSSPSPSPLSSLTLTLTSLLLFLLFSSSSSINQSINQFINLSIKSYM